jgi:hypothetical protein
MSIRPSVAHSYCFYIFMGCVCAAIWREVRVMSGMWGFICRCICRSYVSYPY